MKISSMDTSIETESNLSGLGMRSNGERLFNVDVVSFLCEADGCMPIECDKHNRIV